MRYNFIFILVFFINSAADDQVCLSAQSVTSQKGKLKLVLTEDKNNSISLIQLLKQMLAREQWKTCGFATDIEILKKANSARKVYKYLGNWAKEKYLAALLLADKNDFIEWWLYDVQSNKLIEAKRFKKMADMRLNAEHIADAVWFALLGQEGFFSTRLALCKENKLPSGKMRKDIYITYPYFELNGQEPVLGKKLIANANAFALRWNQKTDNPLLFYSETTVRNVRLMSISMDGARKIVSNLDGMNLFPSTSDDGQKVVYSLSQDGKTQLCLYERDPITGKTNFKQLTFIGNNISPTILPNNDVIFCSDAKGKPNICYYHTDADSVEYLTSEGNCMSPTYNQKTQKIAYCKKSNQTMQIWIYDLTTKQSYQFTTDSGDKEDCSWSPCGNYLVFAYDDGKSSRVVIQSLITRERIFLTNAGERWAYPVWSPKYEASVII